VQALFLSSHKVEIPVLILISKVAHICALKGLAGQLPGQVKRK